MKKFLNISEVSKILELVNKSNNKPLNHILRYWEKEFYQIKPRKINKKRYYSSEQIEVLKKIKFLLKNKGMTISGAKKILNNNTNKLDGDDIHSLRKDYYKHNLKTKTKNILNKIKKIKNYGKKISS